MDLVVEIVKGWGPAAATVLMSIYFLKQSEKREEKKDIRIQLLENLLTESYGERIEAANQVSEAMHNNAVAITGLTTEIRSYIHAKSN